MKAQLILLPENPIIVTDALIEENDFAYHKDGYVSKVYGFNLDAIKLEDGQRWTNDCKKVVAGLPDLPEISFNGFAGELGYDNLETRMIISAQQYALDKAEFGAGVGSLTKMKMAWEDGFKTAQDVDGKLFTKEDMVNCFIEGFHYEPKKEMLDDAASKYVDSLIQPKVFDIEVEPTWVGQCNCICHNEDMRVLHVVACCHPSLVFRIIKV